MLIHNVDPYRRCTTVLAIISMQRYMHTVSFDTVLEVVSDA
jgi:hypothetical protein